MNHVYRVIWSQAQRAWVVVSELVSGRGKSKGANKRAVAPVSILDRHRIEGPATAWPLRLGIFAALLALHGSALAADRWWDSNNTAVGLGDTGTWDTTNSFWSPNNDGVSGPYSVWNNAALDDAFFGGTLGTITLTEPITVHNMSFLDAHGWVLGGDTLTLGGVAPTINSNGNTTINSIIAGSAGLTKVGAGWLQLTGVNTFSGDINVNAGRLILNNNIALGNLANVVYMAAGTELDGNGGAGDMAGRTVSLGDGGEVRLRGTGVGSAFFTGAGTLFAYNGVSLTNDANDYTGRTRFFGNGTVSFTSIADLGIASSLGAPTTVANGVIDVINASQANLNLNYTGDGDSSNRNWQINPGSVPGGPRAQLANMGTGTLTLTGEIALGGGSGNGPHFLAGNADLELLGVISSNIVRDVWFIADTGQTVRLGDASTFTGRAVIRNSGQVEAGTLADSGIVSSLGAGSIINISNGGTLSYTGTGTSTNRDWQMGGSTLNNDGSGALTLSGPVSVAAGTATLGGSFTGGDNIITGVIDGVGSLRSGGDATWLLTGANTYTGSTIVDSGVLRAGSAGAFGGSTSFVVNGGTLNLNGFDQMLTTLSGSGGTLSLGSATLTLEAAAGTSSTYAGSITGSGGLTKLGASTLTLTGANTYTGATTIGGGALNLNFSPASDPAGDIIASASTLNMSGGALNVTGAAGEGNTQTFNGLNITAGNNTIGATSGTGGSMTVNLGTITRTGGLMNFNLPGSGNITTTNMALGGWATVNGTDYAKVEGGNITAFTEADYTDKDNAANWLDNEFITDASGFFGTVNGSVQLGGLRYTLPVSTTVTVNPGETLDVDGTIIVAPSVLNTDQLITGGMLAGAAGGEALSILQNSTGNFTIASQIVDNGGSLGFIKAGTGLVTLSNSNNSYTGATQVVQGSLAVVNIDNGGVASNIGASSADSANLVLEGATLSYTGAGDTSDRGFTFAKSGGILGSGIDVTNPGANLTFTGLVTSPDDATFTKSGSGTLTLANGANDYAGGTIVTGGLLSVNTLANGGQVSGIGRSNSASANLMLDGGGLQYTGATATTDRGMTLGLNNGTINVTDSGTTLTVTGIIAGSGGGLHSLFKEGDGTLMLSGTNTYVGFTTVNGGVLRAGSTQAFGQPNTNNVMTLADAAGVTLDLNNFNNFVGPLNGGGANGGNVTLGSAILQIGGGGGNYSGVISGTGGILRTNSGTQTFNGCNNTYTGATTLQGANLQVDCLADGGAASGIGAASNASTNLVFNNATLTYTGGSVVIDRGFQLLANTGAINVANAGTTLGFSGEISGGGQMRKDGPGTLVLSGTNNATGDTRITGGILRAGSSQSIGNRGMILDNTVGVLLDLDGFDNTLGFLNGGGANGGNIELDSAILTLDYAGGGMASYAGAISGSGGLVMETNNVFVQRLTGCDSSYTGPTMINSGELEVTCLTDGGVNSAIGASISDPANLAINGGTLDYTGSGDSTDRLFTLGTSGGVLSSTGTGTIEFANTGPVTLAGANTARTLTLTGTNTGDNVFSLQLDDNGTGATGLTKTGTGLWRLTNDNSTYTGITTISGGILSVDQMADGGLVSSIGASSNAAANLLIGNGSTLRYTGAGDTTNRQFTLDTGVTFIESSGTGALQFTNTGTVTLSGVNQTRTIALGGTNTGDNTMGGAMGDNGTGATTLAKNDSGIWILTGNNSYSGNTVINDGNLIIGNGGTTGNAGVGDVIVDSPTSTLSLNRSDTFNFDGTLSGPGTLAQIGSGTSVLTSANNQIGATTIDNGTLQVDGSLVSPTVDMTGTSALTVNGTLQAAGGTPAALTGNAGDQTITVGTAGLLLASGDLGDGNDTVELTGTLDTGTGSLSLGDGDDTLILNDGAQMLGGGVSASGGGGIDSLVVNTVLGFTLDGGGIDTFDILTKQNSGELTLTGDHVFDTGSNLDGGSLTVGGSLDTGAVAMADDTTFTVDGSVASGDDVTTLTGSSGSNTINVNNGGALYADGDLGDGLDTVTLAGLLNTSAGSLNLGDGDDVLILRDGAEIAGGVNAGNGLSSDQLVLDNTLALTFDGSQTAGFELLQKQNDGIATMTGSQSFTTSTVINGGELDVDGDLETPAVSLADDTTLNVDGNLQAAGGTPAAIIGSLGDNMVRIGVGGMLLANGDLGLGNDLLDVAGTLDTGGGVFALGDGDDTLIIYDNTNITGTVDAGAGNNTLNTNISTVANLGAVQGFQTLDKTGVGTLNINGSLDSDFSTIQVSAGTLDVTAGGGVVASPGEALDTVVAAGATLNVDGSYTGSAGNDAFDVSGTVSGTGNIDLADGADTLILNDGAVLANVINGGTGADALVLNNSLALSFDGGNTAGFELLQKDNTGEATITGIQTFSGGTTLNAGSLILAGVFETPTVNMADDTVLNVAGSLEAGGGTATAITGSTGSTGSNTVIISGTLLASGDLGDGNDVLDVIGTLDTAGGVFSLGDGDDAFIVHDGTVVLGTVDGGAGQDSFNPDINTSADLGVLTNFEILNKTGIGMLNINGPGLSDFVGVNVLEGMLNLGAAGGISGVQEATVAGGASLMVDGALGFTAGEDVFTVAGGVSGLGSVDMLDGDDTLIIQDGADLSGLSTAIAGGSGYDTLTADIGGSAVLGGAIGFEMLTKTNTGTFSILGAASSQFDTVLVQGGTLYVGVGAVVDPQTTVVDAGATFTVDGVYTGTVDNDTFEVSGTVNGSGTIDLLDGDDVLTLNDGGDISGLVNPLDGGANTPLGDTVVLNFSSDGSFDGESVINFEHLVKQSGGSAILTGNAAFSGSTDLQAGGLTVMGLLATPILDLADDTVLNVEGSLEAGGGTATAITGSAGTNTVTVGAGGVLLATGDLGDGNDVLDVAGTLDTDGGVFSLGDGNDTLTIHDGTVVLGTVDGGTGLDIFNPDIDTSADLGALTNFEILNKTGMGVLNINGPAQSDFIGVNVLEGMLNIGLAGGISGVQDATVAGGATLNLDGDLLFTTGDDTLTVAGTVTGAGSLDLGDGNDTFIIQDGADLSGLATPVSGGVGDDTLITDIASSATLGGVTNFQTLNKTNTGTLLIAGPAMSDFTTVNVDGGTLDIGPAGDVSGVVTTTVAGGATLHVDGSYSGSASDDTLTVSGTVSGSGTIVLGDGDDVLTLNDGAALAAVIDGGGHGAGDSVVLNNADALAFDASNTINFEFLQKDNVGEAILTGSQAFTGGVTLNEGSLILAGLFETPTVELADDTVLNVEGSLEAGAGIAATITGSTGVNTVVISGTLLASGDLGDGNDVLDVVGTLDTNGGTFFLGAGDDTFTVHDGTVVLGTVDGGDGFDTRVYDINLSADLGVLTNFEGVTKTGTGVLNVTGPGATDLQQVEVLGGTLDVHAGASIVATAGESLDTFVAGGSTLNVDGAFGCGDGDDTMTVSGTISGSGIVNLCDGDDVLTLNDGADITGLANPIDGDAGIDTVVLNNADPFTLDVGHIANFEVLQKDNTGEATLTGDHAFSNGTLLNQGTLTAEGELITPFLQMGDDTVLNIEELLEAGGGTAALISGSSGVNTVNVAAGAQLLANGSLGDGDDVLNVAGTLDTGGGVFSLGDGDDTFTIHDGTQVIGTVDGGAGLDTFNPNINTSADLGALVNFEILTKTGTGVLNITGPDTSTFNEVNVNEGTLNLAAAAILTAPIGESLDTTVAGGATLIVDGSLLGGDGTDTLTVTGTVTGSGTINLGDGNDVFTIQDGADLSGLLDPVDGGDGDDTFVADLAGEATLGGAVNFETLTKTNTGTLHVAGPAQSNFVTVNVLGGTLDIGVDGEIAGVQNATVAGGATLNIDGNLLFTPGDDVFTVAGIVTGLSDIDMLDGDDTLIIQDGADLSGLATPVDGGSGSNTLVTDIAGSAILGGVTNFQTLDKTNVGILHIDGPAPSDFTTVNVAGGTLDVGVDGDVSGVVTTTVSGGATLHVDGSYAGSAGDDMLTVSGTVSGSGTIDLGNGDDTLVLNDGAVLANLVDGGGHGTGDTVVLNNAGALEFDASNTINFEFLQKDNAGEATLVGTQSFTGGTTLNDGTLTVVGTLATPTLAMADDTVLNVGGMLAAVGGTTTVLTGSAGDNTVTVGAGGTLLATGNLGDGDNAVIVAGTMDTQGGDFTLGGGQDTLDVIGTLDLGGGSFFLGDGDDNFIVHDGTVVIGTVDGGDGFDTRTYNINTSADLGALVNFEAITKTGTGVLNVTGPGTTDLQQVEVLGGILDVHAGASIVATPNESLDTFVASGATLNVDGEFGCGDSDDTMTVAGTVSGSGTIDLCGGDDTLVLNDGAVLATVIGGGGHGTGDTVVLNNAEALEFDASNTINFEFLQKNNAGEATLVGTQSFTGGTTLNGGTLILAGELFTPILTMADDTTLNIEGLLQADGGNLVMMTGSDGVNTVTVRPDGRLFTAADFGGGNDVFTSDGGTVVGSLAFGAGDDTASFISSDISGLTAIDGGPDGSDVINFHDMEVNGDTLPISNWERLNLFDNTRMNLSSLLELNGGVMSIDASSALFASNNASINADMHNAGLIDTGSSRLTISGDYAGDNGLLQVEVSPANGTSGGLDITGNIGGTTGMIFASDGTDVTEATAIQVITSSNAAPDAFRAVDSDDGRIVRLEGSILPWTFAQDEADNNWYLSTEADHVLPELPAYATLQSLSVVTIRQTDNLVHQRLAGARGAGRPECDLSPEERAEQANTRFLDDCNGFWTAITRDQLELGGNPGFEVSGDDVGLYVGADGAVDRPGRTLRGGAYLGFIQGDYRTTGNGLAEVPAISSASIDLETLTGGFYTSTTWNNGAYINAILNGHRPRAIVQTSDGFKEELTGNSLTLNVRIGRSYRLEHDWMIEPQLQVSASMVNWSDVIDPAGKQLAFNNEVVSTVRAGVRVSKEITRANGTVIRPWATLAALHTLGQSEDQLSVQSSPTATAQTFPNHDLGTSATLDIGLEATLSDRFSVFGVVSTGKGLEGTDLTQHSGYLGMRVRW
jgi:fibronectin-binding autotransporter adhesin